MDKDKTDIIDMLTQLKKELPEEKVYSPVIPSREIEYLPSSALRNISDGSLDSNISGDKTLHKSSNMASQEAIDWANNTRKINARLNEKDKLRNNLRIVNQLTGDEKNKVLEEINKSKSILKELEDPIKPKSYGTVSKLNKLGKKLKIPVAASLAALAGVLSGDASATSVIPVLGEADDLGPERGSEDWQIENPQANPELRRKALESLLRK